MIKKLLILVLAVFFIGLSSAGNYVFENQSGFDLMVIGGNGDVNMSHYLNLGNGSIWFNDSDSKYYYYNETAWLEIGTGASGTSSGSTVPENTVSAFNQASCPAGWVLADGTSGTPDLRGIFIRGAGTSGIMKMANGTNFSATYGQYQNDSSQTHYHTYKTGYSALAGSTSEVIQASTGTGVAGGYTGYITEPSSAGAATGTPRTGAETRPASYALIYCVKTDTEDSSNALFQRLGRYISFLNVTDILNISSGNISLGGGLFYNENGTLKWNGVEVGTGGNTTVNYGQNSSGAYVPLSVDGSGILNLNVVGVASDIWHKVGNVVQLVNSGDVLINGSLSVGDIERSQCPANWILVPGDSNFTNKDFCVMKYEAKEDSNKKIVSQASGTPFVSVSQYEAINACERVGAHLCTLGETVTIARNIERQTANWQGGVVGTGCMYGGHMDNNPANALAASTDNDSYSGTTDTADEAAVCPFDTTNGGKASRRTFSLSNGEVIWDFSGNVWEWTDNLCGVPWNTTAAWVEWNVVGLTDWEKYVAGPSGSYTSSNGVGQFYGCTANGNVFLRGGSWDYGADAGAFALALGSAPSDSYTYVGFRCCK